MNKKDFEEYLNEMFSVSDTLRKTEHCWAGNDKTPTQKYSARKLALEAKYGTVLRRFDPIAFEVEYNDKNRC